MSTIKIVFFGAVIALFIISCSTSSEQQETSEATEAPLPPAEETESEERAAVAMTPVMEHGKKVYNQYCLACHQADGGGVPGNFPTLANTKWTEGEPSVLIPVILNGLQGPIEVKGEPYNAAMAQHAFLSDEEIAAVLTYVRQSFGNDASEITSEEVAEIRANNE